jgi:hypothetical protein
MIFSARRAQSASASLFLIETRLIDVTHSAFNTLAADLQTFAALS